MTSFPWNALLNSETELVSSDKTRGVEDVLLMASDWEGLLMMDVTEYVGESSFASLRET